MKSPALPLFLVFITIIRNARAFYFAQYDCVEEHPRLPWMGGRVQDCAAALIVGFPNSDQAGRFHGGGRPDDPFNLPRTSVVGDCYIKVDLAGEMPVQSSWQTIWTLASTLNTACTHYEDVTASDTAITGGLINGGPRNGLAIKMGRPGYVLGNASRVAVAHATE